jgi:glc operon protein GlcG
MNMIRKTLGVGVVGFAASVLAVSASLAQVDEQFVITGEAAALNGETNMINLATAEAIAKACHRLAGERGETMAIVILDNLGNLTYASRADGETIRSMNFAQRKAETAMRTRASTHLRQNVLARDDSPPRNQFEYNMGFLPNAGGLPIWVGDQIIGFIGIGGSTPRPPEWSDEICAHTALEEVVGPQPPIVADP